MAFPYFLFVFIYGIILLLSLIGWGSLLKKVVFPEGEAGWGQQAAWGISFTVLAGGMMNALRVISNAAVISYIFLGLVCCLLFRPFAGRVSFFSTPVSRLWKENKSGLLFFFLFIILLLANYLFSMVFPVQRSDDLQAYIVFPFKMLEQGSLGQDPFSERRMDALGGQSFLHTLVLVFLQLRNVHVLDPGISSIIVAALLWSLSKNLNIAVKETFVILTAFLLIPWPGNMNTSSLIMGTALFLALFHYEVAQDEGDSKEILKHSFIKALIISALLASKLNFIVPVAFYLIIFYCLRLLHQADKKGVLFEFFAVVFLTLLFLLPWMISSYQASGTLFYPLLGRGYHRSAYGFTEYDHATPGLVIQTVLVTLQDPRCLLLILFGLIGAADPLRKNSFRSIAVGASAFLSLIVVNVLTNSAFKYSYAFFYASLMVLIFHALAASKPRSFLKKAGWVGIILLIYLSLSSMPLWQQYGQMIGWGWRDKGEPDYTNQSDYYMKAQHSVPAGQTILARVKYPFLLNFNRNKIFIVDFLNLGPRPGMPVFTGAEAVSGYLVSQKIRYVMYSYDLGDKDKKNLEIFMNSDDSWVRQQGLFTLRFQDELEELGRTRKKVYNGRKMFVIDLTVRS